MIIIYYIEIIIFYKFENEFCSFLMYCSNHCDSARAQFFYSSTIMVYDILVSLTLLSLYFHEKWLKKKSKPATVFLDEIRIDRIEIEYRLNRI